MAMTSEQDRTYRTNRVCSRVLEVLEDEEAARAWIRRSNRSLGGEAPLSLLNTEVAYELVMDTLSRIEHGIAS
ncbi:MbcA/ParS/Xre antitoxin family protein [Duganella sp. S19_KUP01_CR8]|uniref:MbcA/ParS/Xre antitoxin family protein n=1 Tax=Duganella sp. S19_KUP01_CR8 TaxID=3025502 RepID=UPI002FCDB0B0